MRSPALPSEPASYVAKALSKCPDLFGGWIELTAVNSIQVCGPGGLVGFEDLIGARVPQKTMMFLGPCTDLLAPGGPDCTDDMPTAINSDQPAGTL